MTDEKMTDEQMPDPMKTIEEAVREAGNSPKAALNEINARIESVLDEAPSDATAEFKVVRCAKGYRGLLKISSQQGKFVGGSRGHRFGEVIERIFGEVHEQLEKWRRERATRIETEV